MPVALKLLGIPGRSPARRFSPCCAGRCCTSLVLFALACLYRFGPSRTRPQWRWVTWGSAIAGAIWIVGSLLLSWYVANFGTYNATYGSLGAVIGFMVWMWLSTIVVLMGGGNQRRDGAPDRRGHDRGRPQAHGRARRDDGRRDRRGARLSRELKRCRGVVKP